MDEQTKPRRPIKQVAALDVHRANERFLFVMVIDGDGRLWKTDTLGEVWTEVPTESPPSFGEG